jgi:hypothetical protein
MTPLLDQIAALRTRPGLVPEADQLLAAAAALQSGTLTLEEALKSLHDSPSTTPLPDRADD